MEMFQNSNLEDAAIASKVKNMGGYFEAVEDCIKLLTSETGE